MAGERIGHAYELLVLAILEKRAKARGKGIYWDTDVPMLSKRPDIVIGRELSKPDVILLITHSTSAKNSSFKYWRSVCEYVEAKLFLPEQPRVVNIVFDAAVKPDIKLLYQHTFDASVVIQDLKGGPQLVSWVKRWASDLPKDSGKHLEFARAEIAKATSTTGPLKIVVEELSSLLTKMTFSEESGASQVNLRRRTRPRIPAARTTGLRRGIAKALLFDDCSILWATPASIANAVRPNFWYDLKLFKKSIAGPVLGDPDLIWIRDTLPKETVQALASMAPRREMEVWIEPLRRLDNLAKQHEYVRRNWDDIVTPHGLLKRLKETSGKRFIDSYFGEYYVPPGWLFEYLREIIKVVKGSKTAWGWAVLISDLQNIDQDPDYRRFVAEEAGLRIDELHECWSGYRTVTYALPEWIMGESRQNFELKVTDLPRAAYAFVPHLKSITVAKLDKIPEEIKAFFIANYLEAKLIQYRKFDPLRCLLEEALNAARLEWRRVERYPSAFVEKALNAGAEMNVRSGATDVIQCAGTVIAWQCVSRQGRDHKQKELIGRAFAISQAWVEGSFVPRGGVRKLVLLLDGEVDESDLKALARGGWDEIYFPDEINKLVDSIV